MTGKEKPHILGFLADLIFLTRIESVVEKLGYALEIVESADELTVRDTQTPEHDLGEALHGHEGALIERITQQRPGLIIIDLNNNQVPWAAWIARIKSAPATRRIPILAFGSHREVTTLNQAREAGADAVLARSRFTSEMAGLIQKYYRAPDHERISEACGSRLSSLGIKGIKLFNQREYFEAHEVLEDAWNLDDSAAKELYRAILQVAVAYLQIQRGNYRGAIKMFLRVRQWIEPLPGECRGVNIDQLRMDMLRVEKELLAQGSERLGNFDRNLFKPIQFVKPSSLKDST